MDTLFVLNKPIKTYKLKSKYISPGKMRAVPRPFTRVTFAPDTAEQPPCENKVSFVRLYNELCAEKRIVNRKFWVDVGRNPAQDSSEESIVTPYLSSGDMKVSSRDNTVVPRASSKATAEVMLEIDYGA